MKKMMALAVTTAVLTVGCGLQAAPYRFTISADRADCHYALGAEATFTVKCTDLAKGGKGAGGEVEIQLDNFGDGVQLKRKVDPSKENPIIVRGKLDQPGIGHWTPPEKMKRIDAWLRAGSRK